MQQQRIPAAHLRTCMFCRSYINTFESGNYRKGTAWFKRQRGDNKAGTNSAALVRWVDEYACTFCIGKLIDGVPVGQMGLWDDGA